MFAVVRDEDIDVDEHGAEIKNHNHDDTDDGVCQCLLHRMVMFLADDNVMIMMTCVMMVSTIMTM